jgi:hybrid cluster-associated redox disulfide protein
VQAYRHDMLIRDALLSHEGAAAVFESHGLGCGQCLASSMETLDAVASMHDIPVGVLIADLSALDTDAGRTGEDA